MQAIRQLLKNHPDLLKCSSANPEKKERKRRYDQVIEDNFDKLEDVASEYRMWVAKVPGWRLEAGERVFLFGKKTAEEYGLALHDVGRLFEEVLPQWVRGAVLGFFVSGMYHEVIRDDDLLRFDLSKYSGTVSGLAYRHPRGQLEIVGDRTYYLGVNMKGGQILLRGNAGSHVGRLLQGGQIIIEGNANNWIGQQMRGGLIRIKGNAGDIIGKRMGGGEIVIDGDAGHWLADGMRKGIIRVRGECGSIDKDKTGGKVFRWQEDGWKRIE